VIVRKRRAGGVAPYGCQAYVGRDAYYKLEKEEARARQKPPARKSATAFYSRPQGAMPLSRREPLDALKSVLTTDGLLGGNDFKV